MRYGATYYGRGRDPSSRGGLSGYEQYTRGDVERGCRSRICCGASSPRVACSTPDARRASWSRRCESSTSTPRASTRAAGRSRMRRASVGPSCGARTSRSASPFPSELVRRRHRARDARARAVAQRAACARRTSPCVPRVGGRDDPVVRPESRRPARVGSRARSATSDSPTSMRSAVSSTDPSRKQISLATRRATSRGARHHRVVPVVDESVRSGRASCAVSRSSGVSIPTSRGSASPTRGAST